MKEEEHIKNRLKNIKDQILSDVMAGCYTDHSLFEQKCWVDALEFVLGEDEDV